MTPTNAPGQTPTRDRFVRYERFNKNALGLSPKILTCTNAPNGGKRIDPTITEINPAFNPELKGDFKFK